MKSVLSSLIVLLICASYVVGQVPTKDIKKKYPFVMYTKTYTGTIKKIEPVYANYYSYTFLNVWGERVSCEGYDLSGLRGVQIINTEQVYQYTKCVLDTKNGRRTVYFKDLSSDCWLSLTDKVQNLHLVPGETVTAIIGSFEWLEDEKEWSVVKMQWRGKTYL